MKDKKKPLPPYPLGGTPEQIREWVKIYWSYFPKQPGRVPHKYLSR